MGAVVDMTRLKRLFEYRVASGNIESEILVDFSHSVTGPPGPQSLT
jgi:hypothetical protein